LDDDTEVKYDEFSNIEKLYKMQISHDTLLKYTETLFNSSVILNEIFSNMYPIVLVDEYQDTNAIIYNLLNSIREKYPKFIIGMFGDPYQNLYVQTIDENKIKLKRITKSFSRRSS